MQLADAEKLAHELMRQHSLLPRWKFDFDRAVRRFGSCNERKRLITLSARLTELNSEYEVRDTILHEIAHALVGVRAKHGRKWRRMASIIGCNARSCYGDEVQQPPMKFTGRCPTCGYEVQRSRRRRISCGRCDRKFNPRHLFAWSRTSTNPHSD
ncbi:MAG TPA: SprT-like domain-containing protein [Pirellulales bacterium]|jgi:predicted SprT family Zn-dependent metalloprotease|nr:SprT-like domain-containing protein [Pirellulales bacterium]